MDLENGQTCEMQGSAKNPYRIKNVGNDTLTLPEALPGFSVPVASLFG